MLNKNSFMLLFQFSADMKLMFENCLEYNGPDSSKWSISMFIC